MNANDFSTPQRMSPGAFVIIYSKLFIRSFAPLSAIGVYNILTSASSGKWWAILIILATCLTVPLVWAMISYFPKKFYVKDGNLIFIHGLVDHEKTIVPLDRVHSLRTEKGICFRILDMRGIIFDTLATKQEEIELILDEYEWKRLLAVIDSEENPRDVSSETPSEFNPLSTVRYPVKDLFLASLCQNHLKGMAVLGSLFAVIMGNIQDLSEDDTHNLADFLDSFTESLLASPVKLLMLFAIVYVVILVLWLVKNLLRYYDTTLKYDSRLLTFTFGLLTRASSRFFFDRICTISIKRNILEKKFGFSTIRLRQALNATAQKEEDNMVLYGSDSSSFFLEWWLGKGYAKEPDIKSTRSGRGVFYRHIIFPIIVSIAVTVALLEVGLYMWLSLPVIYLMVMSARGICAMRHSHITLRQDYLVVHNGAFAEIANYLKYSDIEVVRIHRSPLTPRTHRVTLSLSTSGTTFVIRSLPESDALLIRELLLLKSCSRL